MVYPQITGAENPQFYIKENNRRGTIMIINYSSFLFGFQAAFCELTLIFLMALSRVPFSYLSNEHLKIL